MVKLIKAHISFDGNARPRVAEVWIVTGNYGKPLAFGLPRKICYCVCKEDGELGGSVATNL